MALEPRTKSVQLAAGMREDADDFLIEPPAVEYVENGRYDKSGVIAKRRGFEALVDNGLGVSDGVPSFVHAIGNNLYTVHNGGVQAFDGAAWRGVQGIPLVSSSEEASTPSGRGHEHSSMVFDPAWGTVIAYAILGQNPVTPDVKRFVLEHYSLDGKLLFEVAGFGNSPKLTKGTSLVFATVQDTSSGADNLDLFSYDPVARVFAAVAAPFIAAAFLKSYWVFGAAPLRNATDNSTQVSEAREEQANYVLDSDTGVSVLAYTNAAFDVVLQRFDQDWGSPSATVSTAAGITLTGSPAGARYRCLALRAEAGGHYAIIAAGNFDNAIALHSMTVHAVGFDATNAQIWDVLLHTETGFTAPTGISPTEDNRHAPAHATVEIDGADIFYAFYLHHLGFFTTAKYQDTSGLRHGKRVKATGALSDGQAILFHHRLTSEARLLGGNIYVGIQQHFDYTPQFPNGGTQLDMVTLRAIRPVTTALCRVDFTNGRMVPVATVHAVRAMACDTAAAGTDGHLMSLQRDGTDLLLCDREVLGAADVVCSTYNDGGGPPALFTRCHDNTPSEAKTAVTRLAFNTNDVVSAGFGDGVLIGSSIPLWFDGDRLVEALPIEQPEIVSAWFSDSALSTGNLTEQLIATSDGRKFQVVVGYTDARGNLHRSSPSAPVWVPVTEFIAVAPTSTRVSIFFSNPVTAYEGGNKIFFAEVYMAKVDGEDPKLVASTRIEFTAALTPDPFEVRFDPYQDESVTAAAPFVRLAPSQTDFVYTAGGVLPADPWPAFSDSVLTSNRFWVISAEERGTLFFSKRFEEFVAPEFSASLVISLGDERTLTAIGRLDDKIVVFEADQIHIVYGDGPSNTGGGTDFAIHHVTSDVGCIDRKSVVETPRGLVFLSNRGFHLLDRSLRVTYIGGPVEDMAAHVVVDSAQIVPYEGEIRIIVRQDPAFAAPLELGPTADVDYLADGLVRPPNPKFSNTLPADPCLVWNYEKNAWSVFGNHQGNAATIYQNRYTRVLTLWDVWQESLDRWDDPVGTNRLRIISPWIKISQMQDFGQLWKVTFLGRYLSAYRNLLDPVSGLPEVEAGDIRVSLGYDYEAPQTTVQQPLPFNLTTKVFRSNIELQLEPRNEQGSAGVPPDARADRLQIRMKPARQKIQSVQCHVEEVATAFVSEAILQENGDAILLENLGTLGTDSSIVFTLGRGFEITAVDFEYGIHGGSIHSISALRKG